jgi:nicotinate-nucleotide pyrophosphorylase (carboxylating)
MDIDKKLLEEFIIAGLKEDVGSGDHTSKACISPTHRSKAKLLVKQEGIIAGVELAKMIFCHLDPTLSIRVNQADGEAVAHGDIVFEVEGKTRSILMAERLVLNNMQHMSGIASLSRRFLDEVSGLPVILLDTRKTLPLNRYVEKWAVKIGGCENYRFGLYDWIMLKDNHIDACGGVKEALDSVKKYLTTHQLSLKVTLEVRNLEEVDQALAIGGFDRIMLDNFEIPIMAEAVRVINKQFETEASGGVNLFNVRKIAQTGVDYISIGALTHSAEPLDLSLKIIK